METFLRYLESTRLSILAFLLPPALVWIGGVGTLGSETPTFAAVVLAIGFLILTLTHLMLMDLRTIRNEIRPRLGLSRDLGRWSPLISERGALILSGLALIASLLLIPTRPSGSLLLLIGLGAVWMLTKGLTARTRHWRLVFAEVIWPLAMLIAPMMLFASVMLTADEYLGGRAVHATALYSIALAVFVLLCLLRDHPADASERQRTAVTLLGRSGGLGVVFVLLGVYAVIGIRGVSLGLWNWSVPTIGLIGGMASLLLVALDDEDVAPSLWTLTAAVSGIFLIASGG